MFTVVLRATELTLRQLQRGLGCSQSGEFAARPFLAHLRFRALRA